MHLKLTAALTGILLVTPFTGNVLAADIGQLLNQANVMNPTRSRPQKPPRTRPVTISR